ncbi:MAG: type II toxin-antitoxin system PemK/MazF family toxin [Acidobacteriota bacterium]
MNRGDIWWADFGMPFGSEPGYRRPVLVLQADQFNRSRIQTVIVVPMSGNTRLAEAPGNVLCRPGDTGLEKLSVANVSQLAVIDRKRLQERMGTLPPRLLTQVEEGVRLVLDL